MSAWMLGGKGILEKTPLRWEKTLANPWRRKSWLNQPDWFDSHYLFGKPCGASQRLVEQWLPLKSFWKGTGTILRYSYGRTTKVYPSRRSLFFLIWILPKIRKRILKDITKELEGILTEYKANFMAQNPQYYNPKWSYKGNLRTLRSKYRQLLFRDLDYSIFPRISSRLKTKYPSEDLIASPLVWLSLDIVALQGWQYKTWAGIPLMHASSKKWRSGKSGDALSWLPARKYNSIGNM